MLFLILSYLKVGFCLFFILEKKELVLLIKKADWRLLQSKHGVVSAKAISLLAIITCILAYTITYPAIYADRLNTFFKKRKQIKKANQPEQKGLRYADLHGAEGHIFCKSCGYLNYIHVCWYSIRFNNGNGGIKTSYQCRDCGEFVNIEKYDKDMPLPACQCGGQLSQDHLLFCTKCRSNDLNYSVYFFT